MKQDLCEYKVVKDDEEQYSIWPTDKGTSSGWRDTEKVGTKADCLEYIQQVWVDMRPLSLRRQAEYFHGAKGIQTH
jgi:MbtH protein